MIEEIAKLHILALPQTTNSQRGVRFVKILYTIISKIGYIKIEKMNEKVVGAISGIGGLILTLVVDPKQQRKGIGRKLIAKVPRKAFVYTQKSSVDFYLKVGFKKLITIGDTIYLWRK